MRGIVVLRLKKCLFILLAFSCAVAASNLEEEQTAQKTPTSLICLEAETGHVLFEQNSTLRRPPASVLKLMILLMVDEGIERQSWTLNTPIHVSARAQHMGGTQVYLEAGETWELEALAEAVAIASAKAAARARAEALWGSAAAYLRAAHARAHALGMVDTEFHSVHGLPPDEGEAFDQTTARDMAQLARACVARPRLMAWVHQRTLQFREEAPLYYSTNKLLWRMPECDGLKTGYIRAAQFCIAATARKDGVRLIAIVLGAPSSESRFREAASLLENGFGRVRRL
mgnify:CR=1 FL=1